jgi:hypothetical protein
LTARQAIRLRANVSAANVKARSAGRRQNRLHVQKALMEYLLLGREVS